MAKSVHLYGIHSIEQLLKTQPERVMTLFIGSKNPRLEPIIQLAKQYGIAVQHAKPQQLDKWSEGHSHQGVVAQARPAKIYQEADLDDLIERKDGQVLLLVLDGVTDPQNLGSCLRSCDAFGVDGLIMAKDKSAPLTPAAVKIASGAAESIPIFQVTNLARSLEQIKQQGVWVYGTAINDEAQTLEQANITKPAAIVLGAEGKGLRQLTQKSCDHLVYLPMHGVVDSLNVAVAAAVFLYEAQRAG